MLDTVSHAAMRSRSHPIKNHDALEFKSRELIHPMGPVLQLLSAPAAGRCATISSMSFAINAIAGRTALVLDSPHSGVVYPEDFNHACDMQVLRQAEDTHVEKLYDFAPQLGVAWVEALFPRSYLDANRNTTEIDTALLREPWPDPVETDPSALAKVRLGKGLIWRLTDDGLPIYERQLSVAEVRTRIERCWKPYHEAVREAIDAAHATHGYSIHLNCHSMPAVASSHATGHPGLVHADFVLGDREGTSADPRLARAVGEHLEQLGYSVSYNHPYKGVELVRRYGDPARHRHSLQVEVNRKLYMNEHTLALNEGFAGLKRDLRSLVERLLRLDPREL
jgi:N-formylglutamate deformylase